MRLLSEVQSTGYVYETRAKVFSVLSVLVPSWKGVKLPSSVVRAWDAGRGSVSYAMSEPVRQKFTGFQRGTPAVRPTRLRYSLTDPYTMLPWASLMGSGLGSDAVGSGIIGMVFSSLNLTVTITFAAALWRSTSNTCSALLGSIIHPSMLPSIKNSFFSEYIQLE